MFLEFDVFYDYCLQMDTLTQNMQKIITADYQQHIAKGNTIYLNKVATGAFWMGSQEEAFDDEKQ